MWTIKKPCISALETFNTCMSGFTSAELRQRLANIRDDIVAAEAVYDAAAQASELYLIAPAAQVGAVTAKEMETLYDRHMARNKSKGRPIYDRLMIEAEHDVCPFCGHRVVSTLDHTLAKTQHPVFAVTPINLVPSCKDCNHTKGTLTALTENEQLLNAYYDDAMTDPWLSAEVIAGAPPAARFYVDAPAAWEATLAARVQFHFTKLGLAKLYASQAGRQFQNMRSALGEIHDAAGAASVREDLERRARGCRDAMVNSWEGALYTAAAESDWYCDGGFRAR